MTTETGAITARQALLALGPFSDTLLRPLGLPLPLGIKRGYHMHYAYAPEGATNPSRPILDADGGYVLAPMARGIRLTTGVEFARRDASPTPVQLARTEPIARSLVPHLGERLDATPWMGARPCMPDMLPVVGAVPRHSDLWLNFGHQHLGLTLGPVTGRLIAELMTGETPFTDPTPYRAERFL